MPEPILEPCNCSHPSCTRHGISDGVFFQGNGWDKEVAQRYLYARLYADYVGLTTDELIVMVEAIRARGGERKVT